MLFSAFTSFFLIIFSLVFTRAVRSALVLFDHGFAFFPYLWVIAGLRFCLYGRFNHILRRHSPRKAFTLPFWFCGYPCNHRMISVKTGSSIALYVWSDLMSVALTEQIWAMTHDRFSTTKENWSYAFMGSSYTGE